MGTWNNTPKHDFGEKCPKCATMRINLDFRYCNGGCWDDSPPNADGTEHLHWKCECNYEWLTLCADHKPTDARF